MRTTKVTTERIGTGKYRVRVTPIGDKTGYGIPGMILGGNGKWIIQINGQQWSGSYPTLGKAAMALAANNFNL
jgi:hypothetical protein